MSEKIIQRNEERIRGPLKELVRGSVEETPNGLLEAEAEKLTRAALQTRDFDLFFPKRESLWDKPGKFPLTSAVETSTGWKRIVENFVQVVENCATAGIWAAGGKTACHNFVTFSNQKIGQ